MRGNGTDKPGDLSSPVAQLKVVEPSKVSQAFVLDVSCWMFCEKTFVMSLSLSPGRSTQRGG